jgi:hypothetical protein
MYHATSPYKNADSRTIPRREIWGIPSTKFRADKWGSSCLAQSPATKGTARENRPPPGVEKSMLIFEKEKLRIKCDLSKEGEYAGFLEGIWDSFPSRPLLLYETTLKGSSFFLRDFLLIWFK